MLKRVSNYPDLQDYATEELVSVGMVVGSDDGRVADFCDWSLSFPQIPFLLIDTQVGLDAGLIDGGKIFKMHFFIFKSGYVIFSRPYDVCEKELSRAIEFSVAIDLNRWIKEQRYFVGERKMTSILERGPS